MRSAIRLFGYSAIRLFGYSAKHPCGRLFGYSAIRLFGYPAIRLFGYPAKHPCGRLFGYSAIRLFDKRYEDEFNSAKEKVVPIKDFGGRLNSKKSLYFPQKKLLCNSNVLGFIVRPGYKYKPSTIVRDNSQSINTNLSIYFTSNYLLYLPAVRHISQRDLTAF